MTDIPPWARKARSGWRAFQLRQGVPDGEADGLPGLRTLALAEALESETLPPPPLPVTQYSYGGPPIRKGVDRDPGKLLPGFADRLERVLQAMRADGFEPMLWEGWRSFERAAQLAKRGTGIRNSMHCYGAAADVVDSDDTHWSAPRGFWESLRRHAVEQGLHVLYDKDGRDKDLPHVQAVPVREQARFRAMSEDERRVAVA